MVSQKTSFWILKIESSMWETGIIIIQGTWRILEVWEMVANFMYTYMYITHLFHTPWGCLLPADRGKSLPGPWPHPSMLAYCSRASGPASPPGVSLGLAWRGPGAMCRRPLWPRQTGPTWRRCEAWAGSAGYSSPGSGLLINREWAIRSQRSDYRGS